MIYFDNNATTAVAPEVFEAMRPFLTDFYGNASSAYGFAGASRTAVNAARAKCAEMLGAERESEIVFTSGGTESDNWAILGALSYAPEKRKIIISSVEHEAVRKLCDKLERKGYEIVRLEVAEQGALDLDALAAALDEKTAVVSVMLANNETGITFPVEEIARLVKERSNALFHTDGVNAVGKVAVNLKNTEIDLFSISGHKFHAPKGVGALYVRKTIDLPAFLIGGGQESGRRAGTEAVHQIVALGAAAELIKNSDCRDRVFAMRNRLETEILNKIPNSRLTGTDDYARRLPNTSNICFENVNGEAILARLDALGVCVSTGSACNAAAHTASVVLAAMNVPYSLAMGAVRFSLGKYNTESEVEFVIEKLPGIIDDLRRISE